MFEDFSERARWIVFLSRKVAGRRGTAEIEVADLVNALVVEDQGDFLKVFADDAIPGQRVPVMPKYRSFFAAETAAKIRSGLEPLLPKEEPLPDSVDMPVSDAGKRLLMAAKDLSGTAREELSPSHSRVAQVQPLHLLAAALSEEPSEVAEVLKHAGLTKEAVIAAIKADSSF